MAKFTIHFATYTKGIVLLHISDIKYFRRFVQQLTSILPNNLSDELFCSLSFKSEALFLKFAEAHVQLMRASGSRSRAPNSERVMCVFMTESSTNLHTTIRHWTAAVPSTTALSQSFLILSSAKDSCPVWIRDVYADETGKTCIYDTEMTRAGICRPHIQNWINRNLFHWLSFPRRNLIILYICLNNYCDAQTLSILFVSLTLWIVILFSSAWDNMQSPVCDRLSVTKNKVIIHLLFMPVDIYGNECNVMPERVSSRIQVAKMSFLR